MPHFIILIALIGTYIMGKTSYLLYVMCLLKCLNLLRATNISTDEEALLAFKDRITNDPRNLLGSNWTKATPVCDWIGVTCGVRHRRVQTILLSNMSLKGTIPPQIGNLSFLVDFSVSTNQFRGPLPIQLVKLRRLKHLNLGHNIFDGVIPSWIGSFVKLQYLNLVSNNFQGAIPLSLCNLVKLHTLSIARNSLEGRIPDKIGNLYNMKFFSLSNNKLSGAIPVGFSNFSSLQIIDLSHNLLSGSIQIIANWSMSSLRILDLGVNNLTGRLPPNMFDSFPALEELYLSGNLLSSPIPSSLFQCKQLQILSLFNNEFGGGLHRDFGNLTMLQVLYLDHNNFQGELPASIGNLKNLEALTMGRNLIGGKIPLSIGNLTRLRILELEENNLTGDIPSSVGGLVSIEELFLHMNSLDGTLPSTISNISTLMALSLTDNHLSGSLPSTTGLDFPDLEEITIATNNFSGPIPISLSNASKLTEMDFSYNMFTGSIPDSLGDLRNLENIRLGYNRLTSQSLSTLFSSLANCRNLTTIGLDNNPLNSTMPISVGNLSSSLELFDISDSELTGIIPGDIGNLSSLIVLDLGGNDLKGFIPSTIAKLSKLQGLSLQLNRLQGSIPVEVCVVQSLVTIYFGGMGLSGNIPSCFGNLTSLRNVYLQSNRLNSSIPLSFWKLKDILELDMSSNSLSGSLPLVIGNLKVLTLLNLTGNQLSGNIPSTIGGLLSLTTLSLSNNRFEGSIPDSFGDAISLELIDLSFNNLSGEIPKSFEKLKYLKDLNLSFNELRGEIPSGGSFKNMPAQSFLGNKELCGASKFHVHPCKSNTTKRKIALFVIGTTILGLGTIIGILIWYYIRKSRSTRTRQEHSLPLPTLQRISIHELKKATNNFDEVNLLGRGSFGSVYRGTLLNGMLIAVKVYNLEFERASHSFEVECEFLRNIRHRNLVKVISSCYTSEFKALIMEFMPNYSLDKWLYSHNYFLDIIQRLSIMIDVASALEYLHHGSTQAIVHCDLKPNNILLDDDMVAHVTDFGISKLLGEDQSVIQTMTLATVGYMAPEYGSQGLVSINGDIYSFGILLMETFTRRKPTDEMFDGEMSMKQWVNDSVAHGVTQVADPNLLHVDERHYFAKTNCIASIMELALKCCTDLPEERIDSKDVRNALNNIKVKFLGDVQQS